MSDSVERTKCSVCSKIAFDTHTWHTCVKENCSLLLCGNCANYEECSKCPFCKAVNSIKPIVENLNKV